jgi:AAA domain (dynein-related subfamily)
MARLTTTTKEQHRASDGTIWEKADLRHAKVGDVICFCGTEFADVNVINKEFHWRVIENSSNDKQVKLERARRKEEPGIADWNNSGGWRLVALKGRVKRGISQGETTWNLIERTMKLLGKPDPETGETEHRMLLYGPPGTGKTYAAVKYAVRRAQNVSNLYLTEETPAAELRGHFIPRGQEWIWMHGPAIARSMDAGRLVVNELGNASGDVLDFLQAILDDMEIAQLTLPMGETVFPKMGYQVVATTNCEPEDLPPALQDRFTVRFKVTEPHPKAIRRLPLDIRGALNQKASLHLAEARFMSVRSWLAFDRLRRGGLTEPEAATAVFETGAAAVIEALMLQRKGKAYTA